MTEAILYALKEEVFYSIAPVGLAGRPIPNTFRPNPSPCIPPPRSRFNLFWATQPNACPSEVGQCTFLDPGNDNACLKPGLVVNLTYDTSFGECRPAYDGGGGLPEPGASPVVTGATISNLDYVRGLILNILGTNAAQAKTLCGNNPGQRLGYWLDDISGASSGTSIRYVPTNGFTVAQQVQFIQMQAQADMQKLVTYGVAVSVTAAATYVGNNTVALVITAIGENDEMTVVNSTVTKMANAWTWSA